MKRLHQRLTTSVFAVALVVVSPAKAQVPNTLLHSLVNADTNAQARPQRGFSVAIAGRIAVVGAPFDDTGGTDSGITRVHDATTGALLLTLTNPAPAAGDLFGYSVAVSGSRVVVGAHQDDAGAHDAGSAYVYDLSSSTPTTPAVTLNNPTPAIQDFFGYAVAISGRRVIVGAYWNNTGASSAGSASVFELSDAGPAILVATLTNPSPAALEYFGYSVGASGTGVLIGAYGDNTGARAAGSAYFYDFASATPALPTITLTNPNPAAFDFFGISVAISGLRAVVAAFQDDAGGTDVGTVYVYDLGGTTPAVPVATLTNPSPAIGDWFGRAVAISGSRVAVGAPLDNTGASDSGSVYIYDLFGPGPVLPVATLTNPRPLPEGYFGLAVAMDDATVVAGAYGENTAYIFGPAPKLSVVPASPGFATISWRPLTSSGFILQYADSLPVTNWINAPSGVTNPVIIPATSASRFHRLIQQ